MLRADIADLILVCLVFEYMEVVRPLLQQPPVSACLLLLNNIPLHFRYYLHFFLQTRFSQNVHLFIWSELAL
jgi:hypothetical protein